LLLTASRLPGFDRLSLRGREEVNNHSSESKIKIYLNLNFRCFIKKTLTVLGYLSSFISGLCTFIISLDFYSYKPYIMKSKSYFLLLLILSISLSANAQYPEYVKTFDAKPNSIVQVKGDLSQGIDMPDLSWASRSSTACFPGTQNTKFNGKHLLFATQIPPYSEMFITVIPDNKSANMSIYGYQVGTSNYSLPPNMTSCVSCEAEHKWDYPKRGKTQDHTRTIRFNAIQNPYNIVIGVAGAEGLASGSFTVKVDLKTRVENNEQQKPLKIYRAKAEKGKTLAYSGKLEEGVKIHDLSWASRSSTACFPATQNSKFTGNHLFFVTELPSRSVMDIELVPKDKTKNMSLYAYSTGMNSNSYPPELSTCVSCEADHKWDYPKKGKTQDHTRHVSLNAVNNPYKVVIGVAGAEGLTKGDFYLKISLK
jgi:hypothetical protein